MSITKAPRTRVADTAMTAAIVEFTLITAYIHFSLGGPLFTLNALGYLVLAIALTIGAARPHPLVARFSWLPRVGLAGYALATIGAYLVVGPYSTWGVAKGIEVAILTLLAADVVRAYGSPAGLMRAAIASVLGPTNVRAA